MPDQVDNPRRRRGKLLLQSAAITTSALLVWCNRSGDDNMVYANPKGSVYDLPPAADAAPEPTTTAAPNVPETSTSAALPATSAPSGQSADLTSAGAPDAGTPDAKAPSAKPKIPPAPTKPRIYANPKGSLYEDPVDEPLHEPRGVNRERRSGNGSARG